MTRIMLTVVCVCVLSRTTVHASPPSEGSRVPTTSTTRAATAAGGRVVEAQSLVDEARRQLIETMNALNARAEALPDVQQAKVECEQAEQQLFGCTKIWNHEREARGG